MAAIALLIVGLVGCRGRGPLISPVRLFGPVMDNEVIAGRADDSKDDDPIDLLVGETSLVQVDLARRTSRRHRLELADSSACWGLARLQDGTLWTVRDWRQLRQIDDSGRTVREIALDGAQVALFGSGDRLLFQRAQFTAPDQALFAAKPGEPRRQPWSTLRTRAFSLTRAAVAALNLVTCGNTRARERPCWFPDEPAVALIDRDGHTRRLELAGLPRVAPQVLLTSDRPERPVRDAFVDPSGSVWVISTGTPSPGAPDITGGWVLAHFAPSGTPLQRVQLAAAARLILRADEHRVILLMGSGDISEVRL